MFDIKRIRDNAKAFDAGLKKRGLGPLAAQVLKADDERRANLTKLQEAQSRRNSASKEIGKAKAAKDEATASSLMEEVAGLKATIQAGEEQERVHDQGLKDALSGLPNLPFDDVPLGADEDDNVEVRRHGDIPKFDFEPKQHFEIGEALGLMDFESATKISGSRFVFLKGALARLERAIAMFMLDEHTQENGYTEYVPPLLVRDEAAYGTGNLPKFADDLFKTENGFWLIPTAEVSLTNLVAGQIVDGGSLPMRCTSWTPCFRSEAGAAGRDTRGLVRLHQFSKVEMVSIVKPEDALSEHERMTACAEKLLQKLGLAYRTMVLCTGDMGFASRKTYDIEVWVPGQDTYREISSCSVCGDFQARRMNARYREAGSKEVSYVHTLNGSGLAVGRTMVAILENFQQADGSVKVPEVLVPYMGGLTTIS